MPPRRQPLDEETRAELAALTRKLGERQARELLGNLHPEAHARALAGLPVHQGTRLIITSGLASWKGHHAA